VNKDKGQRRKEKGERRKEKGERADVQRFPFREGLGVRGGVPKNRDSNSIQHYD
jgi:hypothetical protein